MEGRKRYKARNSIRSGRPGFLSSLLSESSPIFETDIALLFAGEKAVAGEFLIRTGGWEHIYKIGYDKDFTKGSPGQLLLQLVIERAKASEAADRLSLVSNQDWHRDWAPIPEPTLQINIFKSNLRPIVVRLGRRAVGEYKKARKRIGRHSERSTASGQKQTKKRARSPLRSELDGPLLITLARLMLTPAKVMPEIFKDES